MNDLLPHPWWKNHFSQSPGGGIDYISHDGHVVVAVQRAAQGARGLYTGVMQLALYLTDRPEIGTACLVLNNSRLSMDRLRREWDKIKRLFQPTVSARLSLIAIAKDEVWVEPDGETSRQIAAVFRSASDHASNTTPAIVKPKRWEVFKLLMRRWLLREGPIAIGELAKQVGCAYPTVKETLAKLEQHQSVVRNANRSVELVRFPTRPWRELLALSESARQTIRYQDASGERPDAERLLKRLERMNLSGIALGGVAAARHWHSEFDLHGTPRLDLVLHVPDKDIDLGFVKRLDPALTRVEENGESAALVVRLLRRAESLFDNSPGTNLPFADPVETALDLYDLGLLAQAGQLLARFRPETRLP